MATEPVQLVIPGILTPAEVDARQADNIARLAGRVTHRLSAALERGEKRIDLETKEQEFAIQIIQRIWPAFDKAGWQIINHGISLSLRPK